MLIIQKNLFIPQLRDQIPAAWNFRAENQWFHSWIGTYFCIIYTSSITLAISITNEYPPPLSLIIAK